MSLDRAIEAATEALLEQLSDHQDPDYLARIAVEAAAPYIGNEKCSSHWKTEHEDAMNLARQERARAERAEAEVERLRHRLEWLTGDEAWKEARRCQ